MRKPGVGAGFAGSRKERRNTGIVTTIIPDSQTLESNFSYARRMGRKKMSPGFDGKIRIRRIALIVVVIVLALFVAMSVGSCALYGSINAKIGLGSDSNAQSALVAPQDNEPYYVLFTADLDTETLNQLGNGPDAIVLARIDENAKSVSLMSIPANLRVTLDDGNQHQLRDAGTGSDAEIINAVSKFTNLDIAHYVKTDASGIQNIADALGGVELEITQEVDDPNAGNQYIGSGQQTLNGEQALTFMRASNFTNGIDDQAQNQMTFLATVALRVTNSGGKFGITQAVDSLGSSFKTDVSAESAVSSADKLRGIVMPNIYRGVLPGYENQSDAQGFYIASSSLQSFLEKFKNGEDISSGTVDTSGVDPASVSIEVQNGTNVDGQASQASDQLKAAGFDVKETGNADERVFTETLVVYDGDEHQAEAQAVVEALGVGRAVEGAGYYQYSTDVLVVLGTDWKPLS
ncbi:MAG: LCP family protein [Eggerthellaceae bacterium]